MDLTAILARLKAQPLGLREIGLAADLDAAMSGTRAAPSAYLLPLAEKAEPIDHTGVAEQLERRLADRHRTRTS